MSIWLIFLIILICLFVEVLLLGLAVMFGFFLPGAIYSDEKTFPIWKVGYMPMIKDMKKYWKTNHRFKGYDFGAAIKTYLLNPTHVLLEETPEENDK